MRNSSRVFSVPKTINVDVVSRNERIMRLVENRELGTIEVTTGFYDETEALIGGASYFLSGDKYQLLMSASPTFAPGKPQGEYREIDLWHVLSMTE